MDERVSVIVPVFNVQKYLSCCLNSIIKQTYHDLEIILVDDGSTDRCPGLCDQYAAMDSRIRVIHKTNGGLSDARNKGIDIATGAYLCFVDSDDWIAPDMIERMLDTLQKEKADFCCCGIRSVYEGENRYSDLAPEYCAGSAPLFYKKIYKDNTFPVAAWNKLYKAECWKDVRFPVGKICEDAFTTYLQLDLAEKVVQIPDCLYYYRIRPQSIMTTPFRPARMDEEEAWRCNYQFVQEHYPDVGKFAYDFYLQKVNVLIHTITTDLRPKYSVQYQYLYKILSKNLAYVFFRSSLPFKYRIKYLMDVAKLAKVE